jgi:hypothetical protein
MSTAEDLGKLIFQMNPYTHGPEHPMVFDMFVDAPPPPTPAPGPTPAPPTPAPGPTPVGSAPNVGQAWVEMDTRYPGEWTFKGQPHYVNTALRIAYRWPKYDKDRKFVCWITDYLLIGYEGSNGG